MSSVLAFEPAVLASPVIAQGAGEERGAPRWARGAAPRYDRAMIEDRPVTHLFTDLEGSTRLWEREPQRMHDALNRHDALARALVDRFGGRIVKTTGDGLHAAFDDAADATLACVHFALDLATLSRACALPLRARCGLHAGLARTRDGDYFGSAVNRAARIMGAAHGGQLLMSKAVAGLVHDRLPADVTLRGLGSVRLRDLTSPEHVYQLVHPDLDSDFPPLRSLDTTPNNLPQQPTSLVGRHGAVAELRKLLGAHRLLTIAGAGGIGKTRLALQLAADVLDEYSDGAWLVELAALSDGKLVAETVAQTLGLREMVGTPAATTVADFLATRRVLLILDNCEHLADACAALTNALLRHARELRIVVTSREVLRVRGECLYQLHPLPVPQSDERDPAAALRYPGVALFAERAREQRPAFELTERNLSAVVAICRDLDGIPLALELAAARTYALSVEEVARRLSDRFHLLATGARDALPRHRTLEALVAWSHQLLTAPERALFERLSVFAGGIDLESAEAVCGYSPLEAGAVFEILAGLVDKSLVVAVVEFATVDAAVAAPGEAGAVRDRYRMLETIRAFACEQLAKSEDAAEVARRHAAHFLDLAERADQEIRGPRKPYWCARLSAEHDNLRTAMTYARGPGNDPEAALRLGVKLAAFWRFQGHATEGRAHLRAALAHPDAALHSLPYASAMLQGAILASFQGDNDEARTLGEASLALYRALGRPSEECSTLIVLGVVLQSSGAFDEARARHEQALAIARSRDAKGPQAICLVNLANVDLLRGDTSAARTGLLHALEVLSDNCDSTAGVYAHEMLGQLDLRDGMPLAARERFATARGAAQRTGDVMQAAKSTMLLGRADIALRDFDSGLTQLADGLERLHRLAQKEETLLALEMAAEALQRVGDHASAARLRAASRAARSQYGFHWPPLDRAVYDQDERDALAVLSADAIAALQREGASWPLEKAVEHALARLTAAVPPR